MGILINKLVDIFRQAMLIPLWSQTGRSRWNDSWIWAVLWTKSGQSFGIKVDELQKQDIKSISLISTGRQSWPPDSESSPTTFTGNFIFTPDTLTSSDGLFLTHNDDRSKVNDLTLESGRSWKTILRMKTISLQSGRSLSTVSQYERSPKFWPDILLGPKYGRYNLLSYLNPTQR